MRHILSECKIYLLCFVFVCSSLRCYFTDVSTLVSEYGFADSDILHDSPLMSQSEHTLHMDSDVDDNPANTDVVHNTLDYLNSDMSKAGRDQSSLCHLQSTRNRRCAFRILEYHQTLIKKL